jgi:hypothetical protein
MLAQGEEARFIAAQSRATTLLAVGGVLAGIGVTVAFRFANRNFHWPWQPIGLSVSAAALIAIVLTALAVGSLVWASVIALGVMRQEIKLKMHPALLSEMVANQFPEMLDEDEDQTARLVIDLLAERHSGAQKANGAVNRALRRCGIWMGIAVATGLSACVFALAVSSPSLHGAGAKSPETSPRSR